MNTETPAVILAEPAPAAETVETPEVSLQERLNAATEEEYKTWERTGDIPPVKPKSAEPPPKTETPAASTEVSKEPSAVSASETRPPAKTETAAVPEPARPQKKRTGDARIQQLLDERKERDREWQAKLDEIEKRLPKPAETSEKPESRSAAEPGKTQIKTKPKLADNDPKTGKPFASIQDWSDAVDEWHEQRFEAKLTERFTQSEQQRAHEARERQENETLALKFEPTRKKYADFDKVAGNRELPLPRGGAADLFIRNSENGAEVLYYLGQHPEILQGFYRYTPGKDDKPGRLTGTWENLVDPALQTIELAKIEVRLTGQPVTVATPTPAPKTSAPTKPLPPPPTVLAANTSSAGDVVEEAIKKKDFAAFEAEANRRERKERRS